MSQAVLRVDYLPAGAIQAAEEFQRQWLAQSRALLVEGCSALAIVLPSAAPDHTDWRRALARDLARQVAPARVNVVAGEGAAVDAALAYLDTASGVTGQYLRLDGQGAGNPAH